MNRLSAWPCYVHALRQASTGTPSRAARQRLPARRFCSAVLRPSYLGSRPAAQRLRTAATMAGAPQPKFAAGSEEAVLGPKLHPLLASEGGRWGLISSGEGIERSFKFKTFAKTWDFMTAVSLQCKLKNHHPEWSNVYNVTFIRWTTHNPQGLSAKDVELAAICDSLAKDFGEVVEPQQDTGGSSCEMRRLADTVTAGAGDCCTPKPKA